MTPRQAAVLEARIEARWPGSEVTVTPDDEGAQVYMTADGRNYGFSVKEGGALLRLLLTGSAMPGESGG